MWLRVAWKSETREFACRTGGELTHITIAKRSRDNGCRPEQDMVFSSFNGLYQQLNVFADPQVKGQRLTDYRGKIVSILAARTCRLEKQGCEAF